MFSPCALRVAVSDLCQLTAAFSRVYQTDFKDYCRRKAPPLSAATLVFQRVHQLLLACNTVCVCVCVGGCSLCVICIQPEKRIDVLCVCVSGVEPAGGGVAGLGGREGAGLPAAVPALLLEPRGEVYIT